MFVYNAFIKKFTQNHTNFYLILKKDLNQLFQTLVGWEPK